MAGELDISRRDFINGAALGLAAGTTLAPLELLAGDPGVYPPALTGMRGSHKGSFEVAHSVAREGLRVPRPKRQTGPTYDLVIAGGGVSGLAAALLYRQRAGGNPRILVLDNHDDFGGHAKRNEFDVDGKHLIGYGGSQSIDSPATWSKVSRQVLRDIAIETRPFYDYYDREFNKSRNLGDALYFGAGQYGSDQLHPSVVGGFSGPSDLTGLEQTVAAYPISAEARAALIRLLRGDRDYLAGMGVKERYAYLQKTTYTEFLHTRTGTPKEVTDIFRDQPRGIWGVGWDSCSALEAWRWKAPGTAGFGLDEYADNWIAESEEPYIFHFPDGNASVARALVRKLIPQAIGGNTMEDLVRARVDYGALDQPGNPVRLRLNSTAVDIRNSADGRKADLTYVTAGQAQRVRARHIIYAGYHSMLPGICTGLPANQIAAIRQATKVPLVYINVALRNWRAFANLGIHRVSVARPQLMHSFGLDFPVSMGGYNYPRSPEQPMLVHGTYVPAVPDQGLTPIEQHKLGRQRLYEMSFADFEGQIVSQMNGALAGGGFDAQRDIAAITVNRWPHGYSYEYNELFDDPGFGPDRGPHIAARKQLGRISIANSDASAYAYLNGAIDAASRAVDEQLDT